MEGAGGRRRGIRTLGEVGASGGLPAEPPALPALALVGMRLDAAYRLAVPAFTLRALKGDCTAGPLPADGPPEKYVDVACVGVVGAGRLPSSELLDQFLLAPHQGRITPCMS